MGFTMDIYCSNCKTKFILPDERVPESKKFKLNCPKCREPIIIDKDAQQAAELVAPENFPHDASVAFLFVRDDALRARVGKFFTGKKFYISEARTVSEAISRIRINYYQALVVEENVESGSILEIVKQWNGQRRRDTNIILINGDCPSLHANEAFLRGVNSVIGKKDAVEIEKFLEMSFDEYFGYKEMWDAALQKVQSLR